MRIIAGSRKGTRIVAPRGRATRPTADRVREAAFNLVGPVEGARVLDLYAGSGAMGLEALSRGAAHAVIVDGDRRAVEAIRRNVEKLGLPGAEVVHGDAASRLVADARSGKEYDLVLIDPPYRMTSQSLKALAPQLPSLLAPGALVVVETEEREHPELPLSVRTSRRYGSSRITLFEAPDPEPDGA